MPHNDYIQDYLVHHGIKGQQWGVRNGPPYPIENKVLKKGTELNSVSIYPRTKYKNRGRWTYTYNPKDKWDSSVYKGPFSLYLANYRSGRNYVYEHRYKTIKDLKMPTKKERVNEFIDLYKNNKEIVSSDLNHVRYLRNQSGSTTTSKEAQNIDVKNLKSDSDFKAAYELFNHAMENVSMFKSTQKYADIMSKKYDAMVDDNNQGRYNEAHDPIIIFNANDSLKKAGRTKLVDARTIYNNYKIVENELNKKGKGVYL